MSENPPMRNFPRLRESAVYRTAYFLVSLAVLLLDFIVRKGRRRLKKAL